MALTIESAKAFWSWFAREHPRLSQAFRQSAPMGNSETVGREIAAQLNRVQEGLGFLFGGNVNAVNEFVITAHGRKELIPAVLAMVEWAPPMAGITVRGFRPRMPATDTKIRAGNVELGVADVFFDAFNLPEHQLAISLYIRGLTDENYNALAQTALLLLDHIVGEYDSLTVIGSLTAEPLPDQTEELEPLASLPKLIEWHKAQQR